MEIIFGIHLEGSEWSLEEASLGRVRTGPMGLLGILETRLGLSGEEAHPVRRINGMMALLEELDSPEAWEHQSFHSDPWATARELLDLRDQLVLAGWRGESLEASPRLQGLSRLETAWKGIPPGLGDRLQKVLAALENRQETGIREITLLQPASSHPVLWQRVLESLEAQGTLLVHEEPHSLSEPLAPQSNLEILQASLQGIEGLPPLREDDDSLILLEAPNEWEASELASFWLAAGGDANRNTAVISGSGTQILDLYLRQMNLLRMGKGEASQWREKEQLLPLILALAWEPPHLQTLVEFLTLSVSPVPSWAGRRLLKAISKEPGIGGEAWQQAMGEIKEASEAYDKKDGSSRTQALLEIIPWLTQADRHNPARGIPEVSLLRRCDLVIQSLIPLAGKDPSVHRLMAQAEELKQVAAGQGFLPRILLERILETLRGQGSKGPEALEEAAPWVTVSVPGALPGVTEELLWFAFNDPQIPAPTYWSHEERRELSSLGILPPTGRLLQRLERDSWIRALLLAKKRFLAISIREVEGEAASHHPFWDLLTQHRGGENALRPWPGRNHRGTWSFAGRSLPLQEVKPMEELLPASILEVEPGTIPKPLSLSYSSLSSLLGCPLKWVLEKHGRLKPAESQNIPEGNQMIGTFVHKIVEKLYLGHPAPSGDEAVKISQELYEEMLEAMALSVLEGSGVENRRYRKAVVETIGNLAEELKSRGLKVKGVEVNMEGVLEGIPFGGNADILVEDRDGNPGVVDMKWSNSEKYHQTDLKNGLALQLAAYAWLLSPAGMGATPTAYYMLKQRNFISESSLFSQDPVIPASGKDMVWQSAVASFRNVRKELEQGRILVLGLENLEKKDQEARIIDYREKGLFYQKPPCRFCHFKALCGKEGGKA